MSTLEELLDAAREASDKGAVGTMHLDFFGDDDSAAVMAWAQGRGLTVSAPEEYRDEDNGRYFTARRIPLPGRARIVVHSTWRLIEPPVEPATRTPCSNPRCSHVDDSAHPAGHICPQPAEPAAISPPGTEVQP